MNESGRGGGLTAGRGRASVGGGPDVINIYNDTSLSLLPPPPEPSPYILLSPFLTLHPSFILLSSISFPSACSIHPLSFFLPHNLLHTFSFSLFPSRSFLSIHSPFTSSQPSLYLPLFPFFFFQPFPYTFHSFFLTNVFIGCLSLSHRPIVCPPLSLSLFYQPYRIQNNPPPPFPFLLAPRDDLPPLLSLPVTPLSRLLLTFPRLCDSIVSIRRGRDAAIPDPPVSLGYTADNQIMGRAITPPDASIVSLTGRG